MPNELQKRIELLHLEADTKKKIEIVDKVAMLHEGGILFMGNLEEIMCSPNPMVQQFITGSPEVPLPEGECLPDSLELMKRKKKVSY